MSIVIHAVDLAYAGGGLALGLVARRRRRPATSSAPPANAGPVCQCSHLYAFHTVGGGPCQHTETRYETQRVAIRNKDGNAVKDAYGNVQKQNEVIPLPDFKCACQQYVGPEPLPSVVDLT